MENFDRKSECTAYYNMNQIKIKSIEKLSWDKSKLCPPTNPQSRYYLDSILKNYEKNFDGTFEIIIDVGNRDTNVELETNIGITSSFITACECLGASLYSASVLFASISVEQVLNHDMRLNDHVEISYGKWLSLNPKILKCALKRGLPTDVLLNNDESLDKGDIQFVKWRHKVAHGDTEGFRSTKIPKKIEFGVKYAFTWEPTVEDALNQINKAKKFIEKWGEGKPVLRLH